MWYMLRRPRAVPACGSCRRPAVLGGIGAARLGRKGIQHRTCMTEIKETGDKTLTVSPRKPLSLKRTVESGHVRQSFSHGRSKSVVVEKKKKRTISTPGDADAQAAE